MKRRVTIDLASVKLITWDVDGTLYSPRRLKGRILLRVLKESLAGRGVNARSELGKLAGYRRRIEACREDGGVFLANQLTRMERDSLSQSERCWYGESLAVIGPRPGLRGLLEALSATTSQVVLSDRDAAYKLEALGLRNIFTSVYVGEALGFVKPHPELFQRVASDFQVPTSSILHIGDRVETDERGAHAAGCRSLIFGRDFMSFHDIQIA